MINSIKNIKLIQTCGACPEQYDVYNKKDLIGYIRYRFGRLEAYPVVNRKYLFDTNVLEKQIGGEVDGVLPDDSRADLLKLCITKIVEYHNNL